MESVEPKLPVVRSIAWLGLVDVNPVSDVDIRTTLLAKNLRWNGWKLGTGDDARASAVGEARGMALRERDALHLTRGEETKAPCE